MRFGLLFAILALAALTFGDGVGQKLILGTWTFAQAQPQDNGATLSMPKLEPADWRRATVPGTVLTSLVDDGVYAEPLYGLNNLDIPDSLCRTAYWYRTRVTIPRAYAGRRVWLRFDGINYQADVWVNGHETGQIKGAFKRGIFDVTPYVAPGQDAAIAVRIDPQPNPGDSHQKTLANGTGRNGGVSAKDGATFLCSIGWDWIPTIRDRNTGIWQPVTLFATGPVVLKNASVVSEFPGPGFGRADLTVTVTLDNVTDKLVSGDLVGKIGERVFKTQVFLSPHEKQEVRFEPATNPELRIDEPRLWWPKGYGAPSLYNLHLSFSSGGQTSDEKDVEFGIRKIEYSLPGSDNLALSVNGVPVFCKGGDWGMDEAMKRIDPKRLEAQIRMHQLANYTMIRNWVGQSTSEDFYRLCDKYGILVWDEFFQPNPYDGPNPDDVEAYLANVEDKIIRFRNHPCIALWCARNEGDPPPAIDKGIKDLIASLDPGRLYHANSSAGRGVRSSGPYHWRAPEEFYNFKAAFKTEIGSMSMPTLQALHAMMPERDWGTINEDWAEHDFCKGAQQGDRFEQLTSQRYGKVTDTEDLVRKGQLMTYEAFRAMYEGREAKLFNFSTGVLTWMSNPAQPSFVWQIYTHDLEPNAALFAARCACEPVHVMLDQTNWHVVVVDNQPRPFSGSVRITAYNLDGAVAARFALPVVAKATAATDVGEVPYPDGISAVHFLVAQLLDSKGHVVSENFYWRGSKDKPGDFAALDSMPKVTLQASADSKIVGKKRFVQITVKNPSKTVALMVHLQLHREKSGERVLPVYYDDNYFSLVPGESKTVTIEAAVEDFHGEAPEIGIDGWNVTVAPTYTGVAVAPNG